MLTGRDQTSEPFATPKSCRNIERIGSGDVSVLSVR